MKGYQGIALRHLNTLFQVGAIGELTDAQLLERFTSRRDDTAELAFTVLVERHGPMVLRVCRAVLRDSHEAHDAFQATFLVLVRRAGSLWVRDSLGPWLHQVAHRTASGARSAMARRRRYEGRAAELNDRFANHGDRDDLAGLVHEEVDRLPERYRAAIVLCLLEGLTPEQAAHQLNCPVGTVHSRLARGRVRLRERLTRRGLDRLTGTSAAILASETVSAAVPTALAEDTVWNAIRFASGLGSAGVVPAVVVSLTGEVLRSILMAKFKTAATSLLLLGVITAGVVVWGQQGSTPGLGLTKDIGVTEGQQSSATLPIDAPGRAEDPKREPPALDPRAPENYAKVKSLVEAVRVARRPLKGNPALDHPYDALLVLLTEERVRETIPIAIKSWESRVKRHPEKLSAAHDYFRASIKPKLIEIAEEGAWPEGCSFYYFPLEEKRENITYYGYCLQILVATPGEKYPDFAFPIINVVFGQFGEVVEN